MNPRWSGCGLILSACIAWFLLGYGFMKWKGMVPLLIIAIILTGCASNPQSDSHTVNCGNGYYVKPGQRCP